MFKARPAHRERRRARDHGRVIVNLSNVTTDGSRDSRGIRLEGFQAGDVLGRIVGASFDGNGGDGLRIEEYEGGAIDFRVSNASWTW